MKWTLPTSMEIIGHEHPINADYRDILDIISRLGDDTEEWGVRVYVALALFYQDFEQIPESDYEEALNQMLLFIGCGEQGDGKQHPKTIDWEQDHNIIVSEVNKCAGYDVRGVKFLHWFTFVSLFNMIGDGQLSLIVSIREKKRKNKKLEKWEQEFYKENREKVEFKKKYSSSDLEVLRQWI